MSRNFGIMSGRSALGGDVVVLNTGALALVDAADIPKVSGLEWEYIGGYALTRNEDRLIAMHRVIMGALPGQFVDHVNRDRLDNRRSNLRFCTVSQNSANKLSYFPTRAGYRGVRTEKYFDGFKYRAEIRPMGAKFRGPRRATAEEAARDYDLLAGKHFGSFAVLNFPVQS